MKTLPLLCAAPVVRNLLNVRVGSWPSEANDAAKPFQWQDRRPIKPQPTEVGFGQRCIVRPYCTGTEWPLAYYEMRGSCWNSSSPLIPPANIGDVLYVRESFADDPRFIGATIFKADYPDHPKVQLWTPSIHMPRELSRIHLEVMRVRVERVCDISEEDAEAEGCLSRNIKGIQTWPSLEFKTLWQSLYGADAWSKWCWVYDLKRIK